MPATFEGKPCFIWAAKTKRRRNRRRRTASRQSTREANGKSSRKTCLLPSFCRIPSDTLADTQRVLLQRNPSVPLRQEEIMNRILKIVAIIVAVLIVLLIAIPFFIDANTFRPTLESNLTTALGREVKVGNLSLSL